MIYDNLGNIDKYREDVKLYAALIALKQYVNGVSYDSTSIASINKQECHTCFLKETQLENHHKYIDVHYLLRGAERILVNSSTSGLKRLTEFSEESDCEFFKLSGTERCVELHEGEFLVVYPGESHAPKVAVNDEIATISKVVVKIQR